MKFIIMNSFTKEQILFQLDLLIRERFTGEKECEKNFNILFVNNLIKGKVPRMTSTDTGFFACINCNT